MDMFFLREVTREGNETECSCILNRKEGKQSYLSLEIGKHKKMQEAKMDLKGWGMRERRTSKRKKKEEKPRKQNRRGLVSMVTGHVWPNTSVIF